MNIKNIVIGICSLLFVMVGADKFLMFLEPPCSMMDRLSPVVWKVFGVLQLAAGILIWLPKFRKHVVNFFIVFMLVFTIMHLIYGTYDIGGAVLMAALLGLLAWNPDFMKSKDKA